MKQFKKLIHDILMSFQSSLNFVFNFKVIRDAFYKEKSLQQKSSFADLVTETDKNVEDLLTKMIKAKYPEHRFIGEETTTEKVVFNDEPVWIIDPVDGTTNFVHK